LNALSEMNAKASRGKTRAFGWIIIGTISKPEIAPIARSHA
jgi:hypothetical protein